MNKLNTNLSKNEESSSKEEETTRYPNGLMDRDDSKTVVQLTTCGRVIAVYASIYLASKLTSIHKSSISACLKGKRRSAGGYAWIYREVDLNLEQS